MKSNIWGGNVRQESSARTLFRSERRQEVKGMVCEAGIDSGVETHGWE